MATKGSDNRFPKVILVEGSAPSTPDAGEVKIYAKTDGLVYSKDDAGAETALGGAAGSVATDTIWDAAGDLAVGSGANTAARLALGSAGGSVSRVNGAVAWNSGTSFPTAATGDRYWRTDHGMEFYYDGTRWLCTCPHTSPFIPDVALPFTASTSARLVHPGQGNGLDIWVEDYWALTHVLTTNDGSKYWTATLASASALSTISNTPSTDVMETQAVGASRALASVPVLFVTITKVSTPGNAYFALGILFRFIAT